MGEDLPVQLPFVLDCADEFLGYSIDIRVHCDQQRWAVIPRESSSLSPRFLDLMYRAELGFKSKST